MKNLKKLAATAAMAAALSLGLTGCATTSPADPCLVEDKDRSTGKDGGSIYRVYTSCGVFNVEDALLVGQFNSADTYNGIEVGKSYQLTTYGYRNGFFSMFPNITAAQEVAK